MRFVGTALMAGTIGVFSLLMEGEWIRAGTGKPGATENASPDKSRKVSSGYKHFHDAKGLSVENVDGEKIGTIKDFIVDSKSGQTRYVIVKTGSSLLMRRRLILVPAPAIAITTAKAGVAAIDVTGQRWNRAPEFSKKELSSLARPEKAREIARFYDRTDPMAHTLRTADGRATQLASTGRENNTPQQIGSFRLASELLGSPIVSREGVEVGQISDLLMSFGGAQPLMAIIFTDAFSGSEERFAVPLQLISPASNGKLAVDAKRSDFKSARGFQPENLATLPKGDPREIFRYER